MNGQPCVTSDFLLRSKCSMVPPRLAQGPCGVSSLPFSHNCKLSGLVIEVSGGVPGFSAWCVYMCARMHAWGLSRCIFVFWHRTSSLLPGAYPLSQAGCLGTRTQPASLPVLGLLGLPGLTTHPSFSVGSEGSNSNPHACAGSPWPSELTPQP